MLTNPVLVEVVRSGMVESVHRGRAVVLGPGGRISSTVGDISGPMYPRSCNKPFQAAGMVEAGLLLSPELLALAAASHSGQPRHLAGVVQILEAAGLTQAELQNVPDLPLDPDSLNAYVRGGGVRRRLAQNCSGKHAAMLATCVTNGWDLPTYLNPDHPLQLGIRRVVEQLCQEQSVQVSVDGCGAPLIALTLTGLARGFQAMAEGAHATPHREVADAMRAHPLMVGGEGRSVTMLMQAVPGLFAKDGAEAVYAAAIPGGPAIAVKIDDGNPRAAIVALLELLDREGVDVSELGELAAPLVMGNEVAVGLMRAIKSPH